MKSIVTGGTSGMNENLKKEENFVTLLFLVQD